MEFTTRFGLHSQTTRLREDRTPARRGPLPASHRGRYRPHTVHGLSLDQKDSGPRATPGKRSSVRHISHARPSDGDSALGSSLFARRY
ncbi:hypothetical protein PAMP_025259 [Pampus punctatissimus]